MNVISFSLYGDHPKYIQGMIRNAELAKTIYPGWQVVVYQQGQELETLMALHKLGCIIRDIPDWYPPCPPMFARYLVCDSPFVERALFRDADSRLSQREADAVKAWIDSDLICLVLRDHPAHALIPGGMLGLQVRRNNWKMSKMAELIFDHIQNHPERNHNDFGEDQFFLAKVIWPLFFNSLLQFDSVPGRRFELSAKPWPTKRTDWPRFVGEVWTFDEDGIEYPEREDWKQCPKE